RRHDTGPPRALPRRPAARRTARRPRRDAGDRGPPGGDVRRPRRRADQDLGRVGRPSRLLHRLDPGPGRDPVGRDEGAAMTVHFVGAGPGAADLITLRAAAMLAAADVVLYPGTYLDAEVL